MLLRESIVHLLTPSGLTRESATLVLEPSRLSLAEVSDDFIVSVLTPD